MRTNPAFGHLLRTMDRPTVDRIVRSFPQLEASHAVDASSAQFRRNITFFGGEPLLEANRPIVEYIMERTSINASASFSAITNGTDLTVYEALLGPGLLEFLQITLDMVRRRRMTPGGFTRTARAHSPASLTTSHWRLSVASTSECGRTSTVATSIFCPTSLTQ